MQLASVVTGRSGGVEEAESKPGPGARGEEEEGRREEGGARDARGRLRASRARWRHDTPSLPFATAVPKCFLILCLECSFHPSSLQLASRPFSCKLGDEAAELGYPQTPVPALPWPTPPSLHRVSGAAALRVVWGRREPCALPHLRTPPRLCVCLLLVACR